MDGDELRSVALPDGRAVRVRLATAGDVDRVRSMYEQLPPRDLGRRFFSKHAPCDDVVERWMSPDRPGASIVAEVVDGDGVVTLVAEAGYSLLDDGDGELAITVDPEWRGWLGAWVLDALFELAAERGVPNLHADVLLLNRPMVAVLRHRGSATVDHPDLGQVRLVVGTRGDVPGWAPVKTAPRLLVEGVKGIWWGERFAHDGGWDVRVCAGPGDVDGSRCPLLRGEDCPLVDGADVIVPEFPPDDERGADVVEALRCRHPTATLVFADDVLELLDVEAAGRG